MDRPCNQFFSGSGFARDEYRRVCRSDASDQTQQVQGSVDKTTQRVAFTIGSNKDMVIETGLYNLTKDQATALVTTKYATACKDD